MSYKILQTVEFEKEAKNLSKRYPSFKEDLIDLISSLTKNPIQGISLGNNCYKIRLAIKSKGKGKSGGARMITCVFAIDKELLLVSVYDKAKQATISDDRNKEPLKKLPNLIMSTVKNYLSLIKFSHTIFAMPFALIGFFLGIKNAPIGILEADAVNETIAIWLIGRQLFLVILCMIFARSAAMSFNRYLDRNFDAKNPRTAIREIPKGIISAKSVLIFTIASCGLFMITCFFINKLCFYLSPVALFVVLFYSYTKRFTPLCHLVLGVGLSLAPIGAYLAVTGAFALLPILFSFTVIFWVSGFDIIYALQDEEFDKSNQLYSMPSWLGKSKALRVSEILHLLSFACVVSAGLLGQFGLWYWIGVCVFTGMLIYQHSIVKPNDLSKVNIAFMTANGIASVVFAVFVIADLFLR